jgi:hypothetical protein
MSWSNTSTGIPAREASLMAADRRFPAKEGRALSERLSGGTT